MLAQSQILLIPPDSLELKERIGAGGFGEVFRGTVFVNSTKTLEDLHLYFLLQ